MVFYFPKLMNSGSLKLPRPELLIRLSLKNWTFSPDFNVHLYTRCAKKFKAAERFQVEKEVVKKNHLLIN